MTPKQVQVETAAPRRRPFRERLLDRVRLARPYTKLWFVAAPVTTMALWLVGASVSVGRLAALIASLTLTDAGLTTLNEIWDRATDRASIEPQRRMRPVAAESVAIRQAYAQVVLLACGGLAAAAFVSLPFAGLLALGVAYGVGYSVRPVYLGGRPFVSQLFWLVLWPAIYLGAFIVFHGDVLRGLPYVAATVLFMGLGETLAKDIRDIDNDMAAGKRTTPVAIGAARAATAATAAFAVGSLIYLLAAALLIDRPQALVAALGVVLGLWCVDACRLAALLRERYDKAAARGLHLGSIRVFLVVNLLLILGLDVHR